jgi:hypothetical protein
MWVCYFLLLLSLLCLIGRSWKFRESREFSIQEENSGNCQNCVIPLFIHRCASAEEVGSRQITMSDGVKNGIDSILFPQETWHPSTSSGRRETLWCFYLGRWWEVKIYRIKQICILNIQNKINITEVKLINYTKLQNKY